MVVSCRVSSPSLGQLELLSVSVHAPLQDPERSSDPVVDTDASSYDGRYHHDINVLYVRRIGCGDETARVVITIWIVVGGSRNDLDPLLCFRVQTPVLQGIGMPSMQRASLEIADEYSGSTSNKCGTNLLQTGTSA